MARVTIEDCIEKIGSHFKVVQVAAHRAHQLERGEKPKVDKEKDKSVVIALREITEGKIDETILWKPVVGKELSEQKEELFIESEDVGEAIADADNYSDINEITEEDAEAKLSENDPDKEESNLDALQNLDLEVNEEPETR